ncbi:N-acetylglutamate synthase-like GNAT family acetyltransferase [Rhizobium sp. ERR 922]|uniref:GNAT family N-acetyltransferase n=1 Tax=unclassified Rhizobium TaxID=2613769 RepID=UPI0011A12FEE|nr:MULTISPECIES: GNAT family N-acetyltransferase [unclassified Rhizobium]TWB54948.1 N-acetylglutamate synthase-like GNAT family acetyltransferase [Rhizobium sp. ERR 922]TWB97717.1 N-acetylglutamate synthase-like GNAT family acetyltransferase [Rhizobium sp. ERR 942]
MEAGRLLIREAKESDLHALIALFAADTMGGHGDTAEPSAYDDYANAFRVIAASSNQMLYAAEFAGEVVGTFQTIVVTSLHGRGSSVMIIESVQTRGDMRGQGIGAAMINFCIEEAKRRGMRMVQLTSNAVRKDAHRFYERLGFKPTHLGFKMTLK